METEVFCANHAAIVNDYYARLLRLREKSMQIPQRAFIWSSSPPQTSTALTATAARRKRKRETAAQRRRERLEELVAQGKFVPLGDRVREALQAAYRQFGGARFVLHDFLPRPNGDTSFADVDGTRKVLESLPWMSRGGILETNRLQCNGTDRVVVARLEASAESLVVVPPGASFAQSDVRELGRLGLAKYELIVMDPPWQNKSVFRGKQYCTFNHTNLHRIDIPSIADSQECILAVWVTNRPRYMTCLREEALPAWGFTYHACWYWLKLSRSGELVTPLDSTHRLPVETLLVAFRAKDPVREQKLRQKLGERTRIVLSIPLRHSWKPPPECFFGRDAMTSQDKKIELFARELRPYWTSVGNEVLKFQACTLFEAAQAREP